MSSSDPGARAVRILFSGSVLIIALLAAVYHLPGWPALAVLLAGALTFLAHLLVRGSARRGLCTELFLSLSVLLLLLAGPEYVLRHLGFIYVSGAKFHLSEDKSFAMFAPHPELLWTLDPRSEGVNSFGFPGEEITLAKPANTFRALFLGDSCVQQGHPKLVQRRLKRKFREAGKSFEALNLAVAGYSSAQGVAVARKYAPLLDADVAVLQFGWNDHWRYTEAKDSVLLENASRELPLQRWLRTVYEKSRSLQLARYALEQFQLTRHPLSSELRVPLEEYRENLRQMKSIFGDHGVPVIVVSAPTSHYVRGVPWHLKKLRHIDDEETAIQLHRDYSAATREFALTQGVPLVDLERDWEPLPASQLGELFSSDGIHYRTRGVHEVATRIAQLLQQEFLGPTSP